MKRIIKIYEGLTNGWKRLRREIIEEDIKTEGKFSSALIVILSLLAIGCFAVAFLVLE